MKAPIEKVILDKLLATRKDNVDPDIIYDNGPSSFVDLSQKASFLFNFLIKAQKILDGKIGYIPKEGTYKLITSCPAAFLYCNFFEINKEISVIYDMFHLFGKIGFFEIYGDNTNTGLAQDYAILLYGSDMVKMTLRNCR